MLRLKGLKPDDDNDNDYDGCLSVSEKSIRWGIDIAFEDDQREHRHIDIDIVVVPWMPAGSKSRK